CIAMDPVHARIACKLSFQRTRERGIELEQKQMRILTHPARDLARVHAFARAVLSDHARLAQIHFAGNAFYQRFRAGNDRGDLKRALQKSLEKQNTHEMRIVVRRVQVVQSRSGESTWPVLGELRSALPRS